jgi:hypothetical protein
VKSNYFRSVFVALFLLPQIGFSSFDDIDGVKWKQKLYGRGLHVRRDVAYQRAQAIIERDARLQEAACKVEGGVASREVLSNWCRKLHEAPGFPTEYVCDITINVVCSEAE